MEWRICWIKASRWSDEKIGAERDQSNRCEVLHYLTELVMIPTRSTQWRTHSCGRTFGIAAAFVGLRAPPLLPQGSRNNSLNIRQLNRAKLLGE